MWHTRALTRGCDVAHTPARAHARPAWQVKLLLNEHYLMKYTDFYTNITRGQPDEVVVDTLLDLVDANGDGEIKADEFSAMCFAGANTYFFDDASDGYQSNAHVQGM